MELSTTTTTTTTTILNNLVPEIEEIISQSTTNKERSISEIIIESESSNLPNNNNNTIIQSPQQQQQQQPLTNDPSCTELKNIKYKMRLMNPVNTTEVKTNNNSYDKLQMFLDDEKNKNKLETWNKLNKSMKNKKIEEYINKYIIENNYEDLDKDYMCVYLQTRITQGKLSKNKEVIYDKTTGIIKDIPGFIYNKNTKHVTIKNIDPKHVSTLKNLKTSFKNSITV
jgi:hypothetical protein